GSEILTEIGSFKYRPNLDFRAAIERGALQPFDRLLDRSHLPHPVTGNQFLGLGERPVDYGSRLARELDALSLGSRLKAVARQHDTGLDELFVVFPHLGKDFRIRKHTGLRFLTGLYNNHDSHGSFSFCVIGAGGVWSRLYLYVERGMARSTASLLLALVDIIPPVVNPGIGNRYHLSWFGKT